MVQNVNNPEHMDKYKVEYFTENAYEVFTNYLKNLIKVYIQSPQYPYNIPAVLGIPLFEYALNIKNESELLGRIKLLGQILGVKEIDFESEQYKYHFDMKGKFTITEK